MDPRTQPNPDVTRTFFDHAWLLLLGGIVISLGTDWAARIVAPDALPEVLRTATSTVSLALLELGLALLMYGRTYRRAVSAGVLLGDSVLTIPVPRKPSLVTAGLLLFVEVVALTVVAWLFYVVSVRSLTLQWAQVVAFVSLMVAYFVSFLALLVACGLMVAGVLRARSRR